MNWEDIILMVAGCLVSGSLLGLIAADISKRCRNKVVVLIFDGREE